MWCVVFSSVFKVSNFRSHPVSLLPAVWPHTHGHCAYCYPASAKPPLLPASRHCTSFYCSFLVFIDNFCLPCCPLFFHFPFQFATKYISIPEFLFFHYVARWITVVFLQLSLWVMRICEGFSHHQPVIGTCDKFTSETRLTSSYVRMRVLFCPKSYLLLLLSLLFPCTVNLATFLSFPFLAELEAECWHWVLSKYVVYEAGRW